MDTTDTTHTDSAYARAKRTVRMKRGLQLHAVVYVAVNVLLVVINVLSGGAYWFYWPAIGWGAGLCAHAWVVSNIAAQGVLSPEWEERMIARELDRGAR